MHSFGPIEYFFEASDSLLGHVGRIGFAAWNGNTTLEAVDTISPGLIATSKLVGTSIGLVAVVGPDAAVPSLPVLLAVNKAIRDKTVPIAAMAVWLNGGRFLAAKHFAVATCLSLGFLGFPIKVGETSAAISAWLAEQLKESPEYAAILDKRLEEIATHRPRRPDGPTAGELRQKAALRNVSSSGS